jgi:molecular chaperone DnaK (HSP70)
MSYRIAIDFGTTNSVVAQWNGSTAETLSLPGLSQSGLIPSLVYVQDEVLAGQIVKDRHLDHAPSSRLFRNFKRGIAATASPAPRWIDGVSWSDSDAGEYLLRQIITSLPYSADQIEQLIMTVPVAVFEGYTSWLTKVLTPLVPASTLIRLVDEATAAALGYAVTEPGSVVLVFDFGGGTLDLSLVLLPEQTGDLLGRKQQAAKVIAKIGRVLGGSDIDQWILSDVLARVGLTASQLGSDYAALLTQCEQAKIQLSTDETVTVRFAVAGIPYRVTLTRANLETILEQNGFYAAIHHTIDKVMHTARRQGIYREDVRNVLMVGGVSLIPSVQATLKRYFFNQPIHADKPFTAVVEGALQVAAGCGLNDYLLHSYGVRYLADSQHHYEELIPAGTGYPTQTPIELVLQAAHPEQTAVELVIGEISTDAVKQIEVHYENGQTVFVTKADQSQQQIISLNEKNPLYIPLKPAGIVGTDRIKAAFSIDENRQLRVSVTDLKTRKRLVRDAVITGLR